MNTSLVINSTDDLKKKSKIIYHINPKAKNAQLKQAAQLVNNLSTGTYEGALRVHRTDVEETAQVNFGETSLKIESRDEDYNKVERTITNINNAKSNVVLKEFATKIIGLTNETYVGAERIDKLDVTAEDVEKPSPTLNVGTFTQDGTTYTAAVTYYGDGTLTAINGTLDGSTTAENEILNKFTGTLTVSDADGSFAGTISASEGINYQPAQLRFQKGLRDNSIIYSSGTYNFTGGDGDDTVTTYYASYAAATRNINTGGGNDSVRVEGPHANVNAGDGNDTIKASSAWDKGGAQYQSSAVTAHGGAGDDYIAVNSSSFVYGGDGNDTIYATGGANILRGDAGNDSIVATGGVTNTIYSGSGDNYVSLKTAYSAVQGQLSVVTLDNGNNTVSANLAPSTRVSIIGGEGDNRIAQSYSDTYAGAGSNNVIRLGNGNNSVRAVGSYNGVSVTTGSGNDTIYAGNNPTVNAGEGDNAVTVVSNAYNQSAKVSCGGGNDTIYAVAVGAGNTVSSVFAGGGDNRITLVASQAEGNRSGYSVVYADDGNSKVDVSVKVGGDTTKSGNSQVYLGNGNNTVNIFTDSFNSNLTPYITTGNGNNSITNNAKDASVQTGSGNDTVVINSYIGKNTVKTGAGDDLISVSAGRSYGTLATATIYAGEGNDTINCFNYGGGLIVYNAGDGDDVITGFSGRTYKLQIVGGAYTQDTIGNDLVLTVGEGHITLVGMASGLGSSSIVGTRAS